VAENGFALQYVAADLKKDEEFVWIADAESSQTMYSDPEYLGNKKIASSPVV